MLTEISKNIPTGRDIYIQANFRAFTSPPIRCKGIFIEDELNIHPILTCCNPN